MFAGVSESRIGWSNYLEAIKTLRAQSIEEKIELFLKLVNVGENGVLNRKEIKSLCGFSLEMIRKKGESGEKDSFFERLVDFFTGLFFQAFGSPESEEITVSQIIESMFLQESEEVDLLLSLCGCEKEDAVDKMTLYDNPEQKILEETLQNPEFRLAV